MDKGPGKGELVKRYRNEWKYCCSEEQLAMLAQRIRPLLEPDVHGDENGKYMIHSLYFDDLHDSCAYGNEAGIAERFKYRIRYYGDDSDKLFLERKEKLYGRCHKDFCPITGEEYDAFFTGDVSDLLYGDRHPLVKRFAADVLRCGFTPKAVIDYERFAYVEPTANVRITFDTNISASYAAEDFLEGGYTVFPLQQRSRHVLEVKFDDVLPGHIKTLVSSNEYRQTTFSKYYLGRCRLKEVLL